MTTLVQLWNMALGRLGAEQFISSLDQPGKLAGVCRAFYDQARRACLAEYDWPFAKVLVPLAQTTNTAPPPWAYEYARPACVRVRGIAILPPPASTVAGGANTILSGTASYIDFGGPVPAVGGPAYQGLAEPFVQTDPSPTVIPFTTGAVPQLTITLGTATEQITMGGGGGGSPTGGGGGWNPSNGGGGGSETISTMTVQSAIAQPGGVLQVIWTNALNAAAWCTIDVTDPNGWEPGFVNALSWFLAKEIALNVTGSAAVQQAMMQGAMDALSKASASEGNEETQIASWNADWMDARDGYSRFGYGIGTY
jgi:hypothetical protein